MRKFLILMLVLGVASLANATPTLTVSNSSPIVGSTFYLYISGTMIEASQNMSPPGGGYQSMITLDYANYPSYVVNGNTNANPYISIAGSGTKTTAAGGLAQCSKTTYGNPRFVAAPAAGDWSEDTDVDPGLWFTYELYCDSVGMTVIELVPDWGMSPAASITIGVLIPEPMTMALLGLGGLLLRRRK